LMNGLKPIPIEIDGQVRENHSQILHNVRALRILRNCEQFRIFDWILRFAQYDYLYFN